VPSSYAIAIESVAKKSFRELRRSVFLRGLEGSTTITRVARFFLVKHTKTGENIPDDHKIYQMAIKIPNGGKIDQMAIKYYNIFKTLRNLHLLSFLV
jgi:hypothetical protein